MVRRFDDDPELVLAARFGDEQAFTTLFRRWFDPCVDVARRIVRDDETAAEVAQETFLVAWRQLGSLRDPAAFGGWVLRTSRNKALNRLDRERRSIAVDQDESPVLADLEAGGDVAADVAARDQQQLVWAAAAALGERDASILDLHLRHELDAGEIAEALGVTPNNAHQLLFRMKGRLASGIRAWVLFRGGDPACPDLAVALRRADALRFSASTVKVIGRHVEGCDGCADRQAAVLAPEAMFASVPLLPVGVALREQVAEGLRQAGVPLGPDAAVAVAPGIGSGGEPGAGHSATGPGGADLLSDPADVADPSTASAVGPVSTGTPGADDAGGDEAALPVEPSSDVTASSRARLAAVLVAVLVLLAGGVLWALRTGGDDDVDVVAASESGVTSTVASSTSTEAPPAREPELVIEIEPPADGSTPAPSVAPVPTTAAPVPPPTVPLAPETTVPPPPPSPPVPVIDLFTAGPSAPPGPCAPGQFPVALGWATTAATSVTITGLDAVAPVSGGPDGTATGCALTPSGTWTLTASGPGGTATATTP